MTRKEYFEKKAKEEENENAKQLAYRRRHAQKMVYINHEGLILGPYYPEQAEEKEEALRKNKNKSAIQKLTEDGPSTIGAKCWL